MVGWFVCLSWEAEIDTWRLLDAIELKWADKVHVLPLIWEQLTVCTFQMKVMLEIQEVLRALVRFPLEL